MKPVYLSIKQEATGKRMKELFRKNGYSVKDVQEAMGFESPQAVYKWLSADPFQAWTIFSSSAEFYIPALKISSSLTGILLLYKATYGCQYTRNICV